MQKEVSFFLPDFYSGVFLYHGLRSLYEDRPEMFRESFKIGAVYGCFPGMIWNGGNTITKGSIVNYDLAVQFISLYEKMGIPMRFTFTNPLITEEHLNDQYCNLITSLAHNGKNEILVVSPVLEKYLREKYPNYKYIRSILQTENSCFDTENKYEMSVMQRQKNNDWEYLQSVPEEKRGKIEFLCDENCIDNCPRGYSHYNDLAYFQLYYGHSRIPGDVNCSFKEDGIDMCKKMQNGEGNNRNYISPQDIVDKYLPLGYCNFKLAGRYNIIWMIEESVRYLIKEEYQQDVRIFIWQRYIQNLDFLQFLYKPFVNLPLNFFPREDTTSVFDELFKSNS